MERKELFIVEESSSVYNIRHRAFYFSRDIVLFIGKQQYDKIYSPIFDQLLRSATSIGANLVEGIAGSSKNDFIKFKHIASNETKYRLFLIKETISIDKKEIERLISEAIEISNIIAKIIISIKK